MPVGTQTPRFYTRTQKGNVKILMIGGMKKRKVIKVEMRCIASVQENKNIYRRWG